ncbi:hypothetical protein PENSPDRAFT_653419 [Peniophora sp. CONT]|nr:hypothetical protein PENSPDRAFT_653419 [Peniophora sp. CONT]
MPGLTKVPPVLAPPLPKQQPLLPTELLLHIFNLTYRRNPAWDLAPNGQLPRFARVCRSWLPAARMALYSVLYLSREDEEHGPPLDWTCGALKRALRENPALASLVLEVHFSNSEDCATAMATSDVAKILCLCPNVRRVVLLGWSNYRLGYLRRALEGLHSLEHLLISPYPISGSRSDPFCHLPDLFRMLPHWPRLRTLLVDRDGLGWDPDSPSIYGEDAEKLPQAERDALRLTCAFPIPKGACAHLERVSIMSSLGDRHVAALARMAPNLRALTLPQAGGLSMISLRPALRTWAETLEVLHLNVADDSDFVFGVSVPGDSERCWALDDALACLPRLRELTTKTSVVHPAAFCKGFEALEELALFEVQQSELAPLRFAVNKTLPSLRTLQLAMQDRSYPNPSCELACVNRGIQFSDGLTCGTLTRLNDFCTKRQLPDDLGQATFDGLENAVEYKAWRDRNRDNGEGIPWLDETFADSDVDDF